MPIEPLHAVMSQPARQGLQHDQANATEVFEGHIDFYGYHISARGFFFCGWISHPWRSGDRPRKIVARLGKDNDVESSFVTFYYREDVKDRGIGFVVFINSSSNLIAQLPQLEIYFSASSHSVFPTADAPCLQDDQLVDWLRDILSGGEKDSQRRQMQMLLLGAQSEYIRKSARTATGRLDFYGHHSAAGGWLFCGWISEGWHEDFCPEQVVASFEEGDVVGDAIVVLHPRRDLGGGGEGVIVFIRGQGRPLGALCSISFEVDEIRASLSTGPAVQRLREQELNARIRPILAGSRPGKPHETLVALLNRQPYTGQDTLATLADRIFFEFDDVIFCEPDGVVLMGWFLAKPGAVREIRLRCGPLITIVDLSECITLDRPDVLAAVGAEHGFDDPRCGFVIFLPRSVVPNTRIYIEVETHRHEVGFRTVPPPKLAGMAAIRRLLSSFDVRFTDVPRAYDRVIGPAVESLNRSRLAVKPSVGVIDYGAIPSNPRFSIIVPVHGRLDFVEYQLALLSAYPPNVECEFIYVLDDPQKRKEAQFLFASLYERFRIPFRALLLDRNVGFAPANNIGLEFATGQFVAFVNSDVFPGTSDWLERLAARLLAEPDIGAIGPLLLCEDGSVQHQGMYFTALSEFGGWMFGQHEAKGLRYTGGAELRRCISITGACMLMERSLARRVGGFDEAYVIGDFEDSDLCLKLHRMGLACAVDPEVRLYHLERKSQASAALNWRMNMTLYNAWVHEHRWAETIAAYPGDLGATTAVVAA